MTLSLVRVSVIIPTYNHATLLRSALDSVFAQEDGGFQLEVIVVDDGSRDETPAVVARYPEVHYIRLPTNRGQPAARNVGLAASTGQYVSFLDDDDLWLPFKLRRQVAAMEAAPEAGVLYGQNIVTFGEDVKVWPGANSPSGRVFEQLLMGNFVPIRTVLVRRAAIEAVGGFDENLTVYVANDFWLRLAFRVPFIFQPGPVAIYRRSATGIYISGIRSGRTEVAATRVVEKALALLPPTPASATLAREARARVKLGFAAELEAVGDREGLRHYLGVMLHDLGREAEQAPIRGAVASLLLRVALASGAPERDLLALHEAAAGQPGHRRSPEPRRLWGEVWLRLALTHARSGSRASAARAARHAFRADPASVLRSALPTKSALRRMLGVMRGA